MLTITDTLCVRQRPGRITAAANARFASVSRVLFALVVLMAGCLFNPASLMAQDQSGGEANLKLPDLGSTFNDIWVWRYYARKLKEEDLRLSQRSDK